MEEEGSGGESIVEKQGSSGINGTSEDWVRRDGIRDLREGELEEWRGGSGPSA